MVRLITLAVVGLLLAGCQTTTETTEQFDVVTDEHRALVKRVRKAMADAEGTPGKEYANFLRIPPRKGWVSELAGEKDAELGSLASKYNQIKSIGGRIEQGITWPLPPKAVVPMAKGSINIDGQLNDADWQRAVTYNDTYAFNTTEKAGPDAKTTWKILWDDKYLYFAFDCVDVDLVSPKIERDQPVFSDDCVEMFILPDKRFRSYWELVIGPSGSIYDSIQCKKWDGWACISRTAETVEGLRVGIKLHGTLNKFDDKDQGYTVEVAVPFDQLPGYTRAKPAAGQTLNFMLVRLDKNGGEKGKMVPYAYQPLLSWGHNIWNHAVMELGN